MDRFPVVGWNHLNRIPRTPIEKSSVWSLAGAFLTADAKVGIYFNSAERWVILIRHPKHTGFDRTVFNTRRGTRTTSTTVSRDGENTRAFLARSLSISHRHWPVLVYDIEHLCHPFAVVI
jgi:hypothetical protein